MISSPNRIMIKCNENNIIYNSIRDASRKLNIERGQLTKAIKTKSKINGLSFIVINNAGEVIE